MPTQKVARVNLTKEEFQQWKIHPEVGETIMNFNTPKKKFSSDHRKLIIEYNKKIPPKTWSTSSGNTRTLPNSPWVPDGGKSKSISCHQGQEEGVHEPDNLPTEETSGQDQQLLAMVHETINAPVTHLLIWIKFCLSMELSGVPITSPLIFVMSCLQGIAILLTPTLPLMKTHQTSLNRISCGVSQSVKTTHHSTLIPHLWQLHCG